jgi:hypothetical protein
LRASGSKLIGLDIEGDWNRPLLVNAAELAGWECLFAVTKQPARNSSRNAPPEAVGLESALEGCRHVIACETTRRSVSIYDFPAPRESTAVIVGNEEKGIPQHVLNRAERVVSIPMVPSSLSSVNVAAAAAITLYVLTKDVGRKPRPKSRLQQGDVDVLIEAADDPHELGSLLRSVYAFGWRRVYVADPHRVWFAEDPKVILESRAAARRAKNPLTVLPADRLNPSLYDTVLSCDNARPGLPLSKLRLSKCQKLLVVFGASGIPLDGQLPVSQVKVDHGNPALLPRFRHSGSILLSMISQMLAT